MKRYILTFIFLLFISCGPGKQLSWQKIGYGDIMTEETIENITPGQFEYLCQNDTIPSNLDKWEKTWLQDYETSQVIYQYGYMKREDTIYILTQTETGWTITKRTIRE